jgi:hypothetical protein
MPLLSTFGNSGIQSYGSRGIITGGSALYDSANDYLRVPAGTAFQYGTGDFTIEMWIYPTTTSSPSGNGVTLFVQRGPSYNSQRYLFLFLWPTNQIFLQVPGNDFFIGTQNTVTLNAWNHVALVRRSGSMRIFLNGYANNARANATNYTDASAYAPAFGNLVFNNQYTFQGNITNIRVAKSAYYTATFDPDRRPFTRSSQGATNVQLLLNVTNSATLATDSGPNNITVTNSAVTFSTLTPFNVLYTTPPVVTPVSATVTPSTLTPSEGATVTFTIAGTNTANGTYYYTIEQASGETAITSSDFSSGSLSGSFTITTNSGSFNLTLTKDLFTEGNEIFSIAVRSTSITGPIIGASDEITITDASITPAFTVTPASIGEGSAGSFTVANVGVDGTYYWTVLNSTSVNADFSAVSGSFTVSGSTGGIDNGTGSFSVTPIKDLSTEGTETFQVQVRSGSTSGTIIITSASVSITDVSLTPTVTPAAGSVNEGASLSFTAANLGPNGTYFWSINHGSTAAADFSAENGSFTIAGGGAQDNGTGTFSVTTVNDYATEGAQTFTVSVRTGSVSGTVLATSSSVTVNDTSTTVTASGSPTSFNEGASTTITASATGFPNGTYFWTILNGTTTAADFTATSGSFAVSNGVSGTFAVTAATLGGAEAAETFQVQIRTVSTSGTIIATTGALTINANAT